MKAKTVRWQELVVLVVSIMMLVWFSPWMHGGAPPPIGSGPARETSSDEKQEHSGAPPPDAPKARAKSGEISIPAGGPSTYVLGGGDLVLIRALDVEEFGTAPYRIDMRGNLTLPMAGRVKASGLSIDELESAIGTKLTAYVRDPQVTVTVVETRSQPVSVLGSVKSPGVHQLQGKKSLLEMISMAGGLSPEAGYTIKITRRKSEWGAIPLPGAADDETGEFSVAQVGVHEVMNAEAPEKNIAIKPDDVITVPKGDLVYVLGAVKKSGGFILGERERVTALQALSMAEGFAPYAKDRDARILRKVPQSSDRKEIAVDLKKILDGQRPDVPMQSDDILWIPTSNTKKALARTAEAGISIGTGVAIWRR